MPPSDGQFALELKVMAATDEAITPKPGKNPLLINNQQVQVQILAPPRGASAVLHSPNPNGHGSRAGSDNLAGKLVGITCRIRRGIAELTVHGARGSGAKAKVKASRIDIRILWPHSTDARKKLIWIHEPLLEPGDLFRFAFNFFSLLSGLLRLCEPGHEREHNRTSDQNSGDYEALSSWLLSSRHFRACRKLFRPTCELREIAIWFKL